MPTEIVILATVVVFVLLAIPVIVTMFLRTVEAGTVRIVSWLNGLTRIYRGPGKSLEVPLLTTGTTIPSRAINIDLEVADQTADVDANGMPKPIKVRVLASAIVSVGDTNEMVRTAANKFFSKTIPEQTSILTDLLTSTGRRAVNLLHHDELFNTRMKGPNVTSVVPVNVAAESEEDDRLALIIKSACSRELQDLGLVFNSLNIKEVQSEVAEARRRQSAVEAKANADIVQADQERRAREAQLYAEQQVNDKQRDLDRRKAENAAQIAIAEKEKQLALADLRQAELTATQIAKASADAEQVKIQAQAGAEAEAVRLRTVASAQAEAIRQVNAALSEGGGGYLALRQLEMLPDIAPMIAEALAKSKMVTISGGENGGAAVGTASNISQVIQTVLAAQLVQGAMRPGSGETSSEVPALPETPSLTPAPAPQAPKPPTAQPVPVRRVELKPPQA
jgi:flotillin